MRAVDIIIKKRDKQELTDAEIDFFVREFTTDAIPDYQVSAWAMAILLNGMTARETTALTLAMAHSGAMLDLSDVVDIAVDKHSSGGVGDKTTLSVLPIVAACGLPCGKMSGRGLGFSGGTLDKLESIPGYRVDLSTAEFKSQLHKIGIVLTGQSLDLAPADGKLYSLRDVTGTVPSTSLIAASIMSKKLAAGAQAIVLDVKTGNGAFMATVEAARELAQAMTDIGELAGRQVTALIADMNQPLGEAVGNALEVIEAVQALHGSGPEDFMEHCLHLSAHMLLLGRRAETLEQGRAMAQEALQDGSAFEKFCQLVTAQGGDVSFVQNLEKLPVAPIQEVVQSPQAGYLAGVHARTIGEAAVTLGAGRAKKSDEIDHAVGFLIHKKVGQRVSMGEPLFTIHARKAAQVEQVRQVVLDAFTFSEKPVAPLPLFY
ncbi:MAG: thymidine phosphorylase [Anaerolineales bacterium]|jgi:pyrimidine-nucleoside phosphorylase|nr:thymidine phosphorylase [Anaerolineales bacterium]